MEESWGVPGETWGCPPRLAAGRPRSRCGPLCACPGWPRGPRRGKEEGIPEPGRRSSAGQAELGLAGDLSAPRSRGVSQGDKPCGECRAVSPVSGRAPGVGALCGEPVGFRLAPSPALSHLLQTEQPLEKTLYERSAKENYMATMSPPGCPQYLPRSPRIGTRSSTRGAWGTAGIFQKAPRRLAWY